MTTVLIVDWLGRGGIAQTTDSWTRVARAAGLDVCVVSRPSETLDADVTESKRVPGPLGVVDVHRRLASAVVDTIGRRCPDVVYLQNYWLPPLELRVVSAARRCGAKTVIAVHNHRPHALRAGVGWGLGRLLRAVDTVVTHSTYVAEAIEATHGIAPVEVPLPLPLRVLESEPVEVPEVAASRAGRRVALFFGTLGRGYKGGDVIGQIRHAADDRWLVVAAGVGASSIDGAEIRIDRYVSDSELRWLVEAADITLLPYRDATQSAAVVVSQMLGTPPIVAAIGGIREQIDDGETGIFVPADAPSSSWVRVLEEVDADPTRLSSISASAASSARARQRAAAKGWLDVALAGA